MEALPHLYHDAALAQPAGHSAAAAGTFLCVDGGAGRISHGKMRAQLCSREHIQVVLGNFAAMRLLCCPTLQDQCDELSVEEGCLKALCTLADPEV